MVFGDVAKPALSNLKEQMSLIASLPMYDWPEIRPSWDRLWSLASDILRAQEIAAPQILTHLEDYPPLWTSSDLLLGQTCGWPFVSGLHEYVTAFARFDFNLPDIAPGHYQSIFLTRKPHRFESLLEIGSWIKKEEPLIAVNAPDSQSGHRVLGECFSSLHKVQPDRIAFSGSHRHSIRMLASGEADICAVDTNSWRYALEHEPASKGVYEVGRSKPVPGLPLITAKYLGLDPQEIYLAVKDAITNLPNTDCKRLGLNGLVPATKEDYRFLLDPPFGNLRLAT